MERDNIFCHKFSAKRDKIKAFLIDFVQKSLLFFFFLALLFSIFLHQTMFAFNSYFLCNFSCWLYSVNSTDWGPSAKYGNFRKDFRNIIAHRHVSPKAGFFNAHCQQCIRRFCLRRSCLWFVFNYSHFLRPRYFLCVSYVSKKCDQLNDERKRKKIIGGSHTNLVNFHIVSNKLWEFLKVVY